MGKVENQSEEEKNNIRLQAEKEAEESIKLDEKAKMLGAIQVAEHILPDGKKIKCYFKEPNRMALGASMACMDSDLMKASEIIFDGSCILEVSPEWEKFRNDSGVFMGLIPMLQTLILVKKSTYRKL